MRRIKLNQVRKHNDKYTLVDDEDYDFLNQWNWYLHKRRTKVYAARTIWITTRKRGKVSRTISMHRVLMGVKNPRILVDHADMDGLNNQKINLRICNISQNNANKLSRPNSSSKYLGVHFSKQRDKWCAQIRKNKISAVIGFFSDERDAALAYNQRAKEVHGEFANLNKI